MSYDWKGEETARRQEIRIAASVVLVTLFALAFVPMVL